MLITPSDLKEYTVFDAVKERPDLQLESDIVEATVEIESIVGQDFTDEEYQPLPSKAKIALLKMAQFFALINSDESLVKGYKSEKIGDYSYTLSDGQTIRRPDVYQLLKSYIKAAEPATEGNTKLKVRRL